MTWFYILHVAREPLNTKKNEDEDSEENFQKRVVEGARRMKGWDWGETEERYLNIAERVSATVGLFCR